MLRLTSRQIPWHSHPARATSRAGFSIRRSTIVGSLLLAALGCGEKESESSKVPTVTNSSATATPGGTRPSDFAAPKNIPMH